MAKGYVKKKKTIFEKETEEIRYLLFENLVTKTHLFFAQLHMIYLLIFC